MKIIPLFFFAAALNLPVISAPADSQPPILSQSFDRDILPPAYADSTIYDSRPRALRVHTPTIEVGKDHTLIVAIRDFPLSDGPIPGDMDAVNAIHFLSSKDAGRTWTKPRLFDVGYAINPTFIRGHGADTWMFYNAHNSEIQDDNSVWFCKSTDNFQTWTKPQPIQVGFKVHLIAHNGIQLANGDLVLGFDYDRGNNTEQPFAYAKMDRAAAALISADDGKTWKSHGEIEVPNLVSIPNIKSWPVEQVPVQTADGHLIMFLRTRAGLIYQATSADNGREWTDATPLPFSNNDSKVACITLANGHLVLLWNDCRLVDTSRRYPLMASVSLDGGKSWAYTVTLNDDGAPVQYPALTQQDGRLKIIFGHNRTTIRLMDLDEADLHYGWTIINQRAAWRVADGVLRMTDPAPVPAPTVWNRWSKAVSFLPAKPKQFTLEADVRFDGPIPADGAIGVFSSYQDEDNWQALIWSGAGKVGLEKQQHFGYVSRPEKFRESQKSWLVDRKPVSDRWYHVQITQRAASVEYVVKDKATGAVIQQTKIPTTYDGNFIAMGTLNCTASFDNVELRELAP